MSTSLSALDSSESVSTDRTDVAERLRSGREPGNLRLVLSLWAFFSLLTFLSALLNDQMGLASFYMPPSAALLMAAFNCLLWTFITLAVFYLTQHIRLDGATWLVTLVALLLAGIPLSALLALLKAYLRMLEAIYFTAGNLPTEWRSLRAYLRPLWFLRDYEIFLVVLSCTYARSYFFRYRSREARARLLEQHAVQMQRDLAEARLTALRVQLNPHFVFNALNTVSALVDDTPARARTMIAHLSRLLRDSLDTTLRERTLGAELISARLYLAIVQERFRGQLTCLEDVTDEACECLVPTLLLQPLLENAVKHGIERYGGSATIILSTRVVENMLQISITNTFEDLSCAPVDTTLTSPIGIGLNSTLSRLHYSYGSQHELLLRNADEGVEVVVRLPFHRNLLPLTP